MEAAKRRCSRCCRSVVAASGFLGKRLASKLPGIPFDLTAKNKSLLRQLESDRLRASLYFLPEQLMGKSLKILRGDAFASFKPRLRSRLTSSLPYNSGHKTELAELAAQLQ
jgi:hypothetical protein